MLLNYQKNQGRLSENWQQVRNLGSILLDQAIFLTRKLGVADHKMIISPLKINVEGSFTPQNVSSNECFPMICKSLGFRVILGHNFPKCYQKYRKTSNLPH